MWKDATVPAAAPRLPPAARIKLGEHLAQRQMELNSGQQSHLAGFDSHPYLHEFGYSTEELGQNVLWALQQIPDSVCQAIR